MHARRPSPAPIALAAAGAWGCLLVAAAFLVPVYQDSVAASPTGGAGRFSRTLVGVNGPGSALVVAVPLLATGLVAAALLLRRGRAGLALGWTVTGLLAVFDLLSMLSIGIFLVPVTGALVVACVYTAPRKGSSAAVVPRP
jgi:hypothetical protein